MLDKLSDMQAEYLLAFVREFVAKRAGRQEKLDPITEQISQMNLPVADWETLEGQIESGRLGA